MPIDAPIEPDFSPNAMDPPTWGKYHASIIRVDEEGGKRGEMVVDFEVLAGDPQGEEGKVHRSYFAKSPKAMGRIHQLAMATGLVTVEQLKDMKQRGVTPTYDFEGAAVDRQVFIHLEKDEYQGKEKAKLGFAIYHPTDSKVKDWVKNKAMLAAAGFDVSEMSAGTPSEPVVGNGQASAASADVTLSDDVFKDVF